MISYEIWIIILWTGAFLTLHSYIFFPLFLKAITKNKSLSDYKKYNVGNNLPFVSIVMAVHNEERVIANKIESVFNSNYPTNKIEFLIGSDCSTDATNEILEKLTKKYPIKLFNYSQRTGKVKIINDLVQLASHDIIISTDAKAFFLSDTIYQLITYLKDERVGATGGYLLNKVTDKTGISIQENKYMDREMDIKYWETLYCGCPVGLYGAMYAIKKEYFVSVPENMFVDDFYITMKIYEQGKKAIFNSKAQAVENVPNAISEEFRRKVRIAIGNYQNLKAFAHIFLLHPFSKLGFCFFSHKVLRWKVPFFMIFAGIALLFLYPYSQFYKLLGIGYLLFLTIPILDKIFISVGIHLKALRFITHFIVMNLALLVGFIKFLKGADKAIWQPSRR